MASADDDTAAKLARDYAAWLQSAAVADAKAEIEALQVRLASLFLGCGVACAVCVRACVRAAPRKPVWGTPCRACTRTTLSETKHKRRISTHTRARTRAHARSGGGRAAAGHAAEQVGRGGAQGADRRCVCVCVCVCVWRCVCVALRV
jgi:hypothetical protein